MDGVAAGALLLIRAMLAPPHLSSAFCSKRVRGGILQRPFLQAVFTVRPAPPRPSIAARMETRLVPVALCGRYATQITNCYSSQTLPSRLVAHRLVPQDDD